LCDLNLQSYIDRQFTPTMREQVPYLTIDQPPKINVLQIWSIMTDIAGGLTFIHEHGEVHRDLKPGNGIISLCKSY
jgi:serine/threonine protein kinase